MVQTNQATTGGRAYGYQAFGRFREIVRLEREGIVYRGKTLLRWSDIVAYRAYPHFYGDSVFAALRAPQPRLTLYLQSGRIILVRGTLLRRRGDQSGVVRFVTDQVLEP